MRLKRKISALFVPIACLSLFYYASCTPATVCTSDDQCPKESVCEKNACIPRCESDSSCSSGETCNNGRCVASTKTDGGAEKSPIEQEPEPVAEPVAEPTAEPTAEAGPEEATPEENEPEKEPEPEMVTCVPQQETCNNQDDDCDGMVDEGLTQSCYSGAAGTEGTGLCKGGTQTCTAGQWGTCVGEVVPTTETCNNKDDNCDGMVDEGLTQSCYSGPAGTAGKGACKGGTQTCNAGQWDTCVGEVTPTTETCNNKDDDCDGKTDEAVTQSCYNGPAGTAGKGLCKSGTQTCTAGQWGTCVGEVAPATETCNNKDDDCDGKIDETVTKTCYTGPANTAGKGSCQNGTQTCGAGQWGACTGQVVPTTETCNNKDDDCDGKTDETLTQACYTGPTGTSGKGLCKNGTQTCGSGQWGTCVGQVVPTTETCNSKDDDCDGQIDEAITQTCYTGPAGTAGKGLCKSGVQTCNAGRFGTCVGQVIPTAETCNNKDDDCDGKIDEAVTQSCYSGPAGTAGKGSCKNGTQTCSAGQWSACTGEVTPNLDICGNGKDEDCDGQIDKNGVGCCGISGGYLYCWFKQTTTWTSAQSACQAWGGNLAGAANSTENSFLASISSGSTWLGGIYNHTTKTGTWVSGKTWGYTNWDPQEPNNSGGSEQYVETNAYNSSGRWNDAANSSRFSYICERKAVTCTTNANCPTATPRCDASKVCVK
ncbi:MAG: hypothetical protein H6728_11790 [Myxococcales bacterium]|nr:hypothetical protein [Myxococcales bacterium]